MKQISNEYKENVKLFGRQLDSIISYVQNGETIELGATELNSITPHYESQILKSAMKQLDIDSNVDIPIGTILNYRFGVFTGEEYEYINYGNYIVYSSEKQEDTNSYKIICYDKMLYAMKDYTKMEIEYPISIRDYVLKICNYIGIPFKNENEEFANYDKEIENELYFDNNGASLGYTFRDVLDEIAQVTVSTICINGNDELEIRYINDTQNKNLFDNTKVVKGRLDNGVIGYESDVSSIEATKDSVIFTTTKNWRGVTSDYIKVEPNTSYTYSSNEILSSNTYQIEIDTYDENKDFLYRATLTRVNNTAKFTTNDNVEYIRIYMMLSTAKTFTINNIQFEKGEEKTDYISYGLDTIDEHYLKDINVNFGEKYGPVNSIVLSRAAESDNVYLQDEESIVQNGLCEIKIKDNQIMNFNNRDEFLPDILEKLNGLEYYLNDYSSTGITYYEMCDKYNIQIGENTYPCIMFNDEVLITQGLEENVHTDRPEESETPYDKADKTDRRINQTNLIVNKQEQTIEGIISEQTEQSERITRIIADINAIQNLFQLTGGSNLIKDSQLLLRDEGLWEYGGAAVDSFFPGNDEYPSSSEHPLEYYFDEADYVGGYDATLIGKTVAIAKIGISNGKMTTSSTNINGLLVDNMYTISFKVTNDENTSSKIKLIGNGNVVFEETFDEAIDLEDRTFSFVAQTSNYTLEIQSTSTTNGYVYIYDLMLNKGDMKPWEPAAGELVSTVIKLSQMGIQVYSSGSEIATLMTSEGFDIRRYSNGTLYEIVTQFNKDGFTSKKGILEQLQIGNFDFKAVNYKGYETLVLYKKESD